MPRIASVEQKLWNQTQKYSYKSIWTMSNFYIEQLR